jgi:NADH:ubiquinone oxidoreductase subunit 6 (subunit J)
VNLLVYVGALAVLFLFVIMLLEIPATELRAYARGWSTLALFGLLACNRLTVSFASSFFPVVFNSTNSIFKSAPLITFIPAMESINSLGEALYIHYADILILNSMVLTIALFGALVLAHIRPVN